MNLAPQVIRYLTLHIYTYIPQYKTIYSKIASFEYLLKHLRSYLSLVASD